MNSIIVSFSIFNFLCIVAFFISIILLIIRAALIGTYPWLSFLILRRLSLALNAAAPPPPPDSTADVDEAPALMDCDEFISDGANAEDAEEETAVLLAASLALSVDAADEEDVDGAPAAIPEVEPPEAIPDAFGGRSTAGADDVDAATKSSVVCRFALI